MMAGLLTIPASDYHADQVADVPTLSASLVHILCNASPAHARAAHPKLNPLLERVEETKFEIGTAAHAMLLEGRQIVRVVEADDWRTKAAKEERDDARANGLVPLLAKDWARVQEMVAAVQPQIEVVGCEPALFAPGKPEQTIVWDENGVLCRARVDWLHDDRAAIDDVKTTSRSADPASWSRAMLGFGAHTQARFYQRGCKKLFGVEPDFRFVVVETSAPFAVAVVSLAPSLAALADAQLDYALTTWKRCLNSNTWPAYASRVHYAESPGWAETQWLDRAYADEVMA